MTTYGLTDTGFVTKTLQVIKEEIQESLKDSISDSLDFSSEKNLGQQIGIDANQLSELWEVQEDIVNAFSPGNATGDMLSNIALLTGTIRLDADYSTVNAICTGDNLTVITAGSQASVSGTGDIFEVDSNTTLATATAWVHTTAYVIGDVRSNNNNIYYCITAGTSAGAGGPTTEATDITDGTVHWRFCGDGLAYASVAFTASETGPVNCNAWTLTSIETPISGWDNVTNPLDADEGRDIETDAELRIRREQRLRLSGSGSLDAIVADVLDVTDVESAIGFENVYEYYVGLLPPNSFEIVVLGGAVNDIAQAIWDSKGAGIRSYGLTSGTATDDNGTSRTIYFTRPTEKTIYMNIVLVTDSDYPTDGDTQVKEALVTFGNAFGIGDDVIRTKLYDIIFNISGVVDVTTLEIGFTALTVSTSNLTIGEKELSKFDTSYITIT